MICRRCHLAMKFSQGSQYWECPSGHKVYEHHHDEDQRSQAVSVEIPQEEKHETGNSAYKRRVERKLVARKKWLENLCLTEEDVKVDKDGNEHVELPGLEEVHHHPVPDKLTRKKVFSYSGNTYSFPTTHE